MPNGCNPPLTIWEVLRIAASFRLLTREEAFSLLFPPSCLKKYCISYFETITAAATELLPYFFLINQ